MKIENKSLNPMCPSCTLYASGECAGTDCQVWTGCVYKRNADPEKTICKPRLVINEAGKGTDHAYNVQLWHSYDGGKTFWYSGFGRYFADYREAEAWRKEQRKNLAYDLMFGRLGNGTTVCNMAREEHGDYQNVAHIDDCGAVDWYIDREKLPPYVLEDINEQAAAQADNFKHGFMHLPKSAALKMLNERLTARQLLTMICEDNMYEKSMEEIYNIYIEYVCKNDKRIMPAE